MNVQPLRDNLLVRRLEGHGVERTTKGGIVIPATSEARAKTKKDFFRARVLAIGPDVREIAVGEDVLVWTWAEDNGDAKKLYVWGNAHAPSPDIFIKPGDVLCVVDPLAEVA